MRILQLIHTAQLRGAEVFASQLANHLSARKHQVFIVSVYKGKAALPTDMDVISMNASKTLDLPAMRKLARFIEENNIDIVQANAGDTLRFAVLSRAIYRWKARLVFRNASTISRYMTSYMQQWMYRILFRQVDYIVSVSEKCKDDLLELFPRFRDKISVIPIGVENTPALKPSLAALNNKQVILHVGGFSFEKNHKGLLNIFSLVHRQMPGSELWLVGDGPLRRQVEARVKKLGLENNVRFFGAQPNAMDFMKQASVFVLPSIIEGLPGVILEAMHAGLPVVAYNVGGIPEVVMHQQTGWLIQPNDEERFAETLVQILSNPGKGTRRVTDSARRLVQTHFRNDVIARRFHEIYQKVLPTRLRVVRGAA